MKFKLCPGHVASPAQTLADNHVSPHLHQNYNHQLPIYVFGLWKVTSATNFTHEKRKKTKQSHQCANNHFKLSGHLFLT